MGADLQLGPVRRRANGPELRAPARYLIFFGSQTWAFFLTTAPQSLQRYRPFFGLLED
jgi:hypothetical protein